MKKFMFLLTLMFAIGQYARSQTDFSVVWDKDFFPKTFSFSKFSADGNYFYAWADDLEKRSVQNGEVLSHFANTISLEAPTDMDISKLGNYIVTSNERSGAGIWDTRSEKAVKFIYDNVSSPQDLYIYCVAISPDEKYILVGSRVNGGSNIIVYDLLNENEIKRIPIAGRLSAVRFSHDGTKFAVGTLTDDLYEGKKNNLSLWDAKTWTKITNIEDIKDTYANQYDFVKFSHDDKYLGCRTLYSGRIYDITTNKLFLASDNNKHLYNLCFLPDDNYYIIYYFLNSSNHGIDLFDFKNTFIKSYKVDGHINLESIKLADGKINILCLGGSSFRLLQSNMNSVPNDNDKLFKLYSNYDSLFFETNNLFSNAIRLELFDILGNSVFNINLEVSKNGKYEIKTNLQSGNYIAVLTSGTQKYSQKIEIVR